MRGYEEMVREFHVKQGHWIYEVDGAPPVEIKLLRLRLIAEELGELTNAVELGGGLELIADGAGDLGYVLAGTSVSFGLGLDEALKQKSRRREPGTSVGDFGRLACAIHQGTRTEIKSALLDLFEGLLEVAESWGITSYYGIFCEIHRSNLTKQGKNLPVGSKGGLKGPDYSPPNLGPILGMNPGHLGSPERSKDG